MTFTSRSMEWLNQNRYRSYPMERDAWRSVVSPESRLDCVLLDATVFNNDAYGDEVLSVERISVGAGSTSVTMKYGGIEFPVTLSGGDVSGDGSFDIKRGAVHGSGLRGASISMFFSSHAYIRENAGEGTWDIGCPVLGSRVVSLTDGMGVDGMSVNGSSGIDGHDSPAVASGDVVLEDGYRTSPIIHRGEVLVRVGRRYGYDPCFYDFGDSEGRDCRLPMFYFCGQNAVNGGNIVIKGGKGIGVSQGRKYTIRRGPYNLVGKTIPCIEITAGRELLDIYRARVDGDEQNLGDLPANKMV